jgi:hypothetical protein
VVNQVSNDFTISFWVKTTQVGGSGQWYQGRGLADGFTAAGANDFGTALNGNSFAFGVGNPDTTLISAIPINDGAWHQCVATRAASTGAVAVYVDGNFQASGVGGTNILNPSQYLRFGSRQTGANFFAGNLDDIRIYSRALGSNEVTALYWDSSHLAAAPTNLTALASNGRVTLTWPSLLGITGYDLKRSTTPGGPYASVTTAFDTTYSDYNVTNGTTYYYVVAGMNSLGDGTNSPEASATPSLASSLKTWFKADALVGLANGAPVSDWPDLSGNGADATQANPIQQPSYVTGAINGLPTVHFSNANSNYLAFPRLVQDDFTIFCLFRTSQGYGTGNLYCQGAGLVNGEVSGVTTDFGSCLFTNGQVCAGTGSPDVAVNSTPGFNDGKPHVMTFRRTESSGKVELFVDGVSMGSVTGSTSALMAPQRLVLGAQQTMIYFLNGDIAEVVIYDSALTDADRASEESHLQYKYGMLPKPALSLQPNGGTSALTISWPAYASNWVLYYTAVLMPPLDWLPVTNQVASNNGQFSVSVPMDSDARFFRLYGP